MRPWWSWLGGGAGATIGYIVANVPGAVAGGSDVPLVSFSADLAVGFAGNRLGAIRDAKGKSVAQVFSGLQASQKAEVRSHEVLADEKRFCGLSPSRCWGVCSNIDRL